MIDATEWMFMCMYCAVLVLLGVVAMACKYAHCATVTVNVEPGYYRVNVVDGDDSEGEDEEEEETEARDDVEENPSEGGDDESDKKDV